MLLILVLTTSAFPLAAQIEPPSFVGARKCRVCHRSDDAGNQYAKWLETGHANTLDLLRTDKAIETAKSYGIDGPPSQATACLECHVTGWGKPGGYQLLSEDFIADEANKRAVRLNESLGKVGCEMCHGPGSAYKGKKTMEGIFAGAIDPASVGLRKPSEGDCLVCHNERSPNFKKFDFDIRVAKIAHPYPEGFRSN